MRPERIALTAFGPFVAEQVVDFSDLEDKGFFLITGPTGSGKTTLLDALVFALFGKTSGDERDASAMRSQHAPPELLTEVTLDFAIGGERYRVHRIPEQQRASRRGGGTTTQKSEATLYCRTHASGNEDGITQAYGSRDVDSACERLLGMNAAQFRQVIVLPQGRFRDFLSANSKERGEVLEQLFDTARFAGIEQALKERAAELERELGDAVTERSVLLSQAGTDSLAELKQRVPEVKSELERATAQLKGRVKAHERALRACEKGRNHQVLLDAVVQAKAEVDAFKEDEPRIERLRQRLNDADRATKLETHLARVEGCREVLEEESSELVDAQGELDAARQESLRASETKQGLAQDAALLLRQSQLITRAAETFLAEADAQVAEIEEAWTSGQAALLAGALEDGRPCPVCGSTDHPAPAHGDEKPPSEKDVEGARKSRREADNLLADAKALARDLKTLVRGLTVPKVADLPEPEAIDTEREARAQLAEATARLDDLSGGIQRASDDATNALTDEKAGKKALSSAKARVEDAKKKKGDAEKVLKTKLVAAGFTDEAAAVAARLDEDEAEAIGQEVEEFGKEQAAAKKALAKAREAAKGVKPPDMTALETAESESQKERDDAIREEQDLRGRLAQANKWIAELRTVEATIRRRQGLREVACGLDRVASGRNDHRLSFRRFVLGALLDDVLAHATQRLLGMSRGRFTLRRATDVADGRSAAGLELEVDDAYTGQARPVSTLSGGEGFQAALALALGLADTVQQWSGGIRMDAVFVDEGFGSLDQEALGSAIDILLALQASGRLVGIISHVPELKERIDARLEVTAEGNGTSRARFVV